MFLVCSSFVASRCSQHSRGFPAGWETVALQGAVGQVLFNAMPVLVVTGKPLSSDHPKVYVPGSRLPLVH